MISDALQWVRSAVFVVQMYVALALLAIAYAPLVVLDDRWAMRAVHAYCRYVRWSVRWLVGLRSQIRGQPPTDEVLVAAKHQSFFDIILIVSALPQPRFIMKKELTRAPFLGWYARKIGCVPVDRGRRGQAIQKMMEDVGRSRLRPGQLVIYPQGTRVAPGDPAPYKMGTAVLYSQLGQECVPAAANVGVFWPKRSLLRRPGLAVVEFLPRIAPGLPHAEFMRRLESEIEGGSNRLMEEASFSLLQAQANAVGTGR